MTCQEVARLIDPYMDEELGEEQSAVVAEHLDACASCHGQLEQRRALGQLIRRLPYYDAPPQLRTAVSRAQMSVHRRRHVRAWMAAAAVTVLSVGTVEGLRFRRTSETTFAVAEAVVARHVEAMARPRVIDVPSSDQHTVKPWFQGKLDFSPPVPDLASAGFVLVGGRMDLVNGRPAAALVYRRRLHMINVFVWPARDDARGRDARTIRGFHEQHWTSGDLSVWAVSDVSEDDLKTFAQLFAGASR